MAAALVLCCLYFYLFMFSLICLVCKESCRFIVLSSAIRCRMNSDLIWLFTSRNSNLSARFPTAGVFNSKVQSTDKYELRGLWSSSHGLTKVGICGWHLQVQESAELPSLCWTTPTSEWFPRRQRFSAAGRLGGAAGARSAPVACWTPHGPPAPPAPAHQACPLESRATKTQMLRVCKASVYRVY